MVCISVTLIAETRLNGLEMICRSKEICKTLLTFVVFLPSTVKVSKTHVTALSTSLPCWFTAFLFSSFQERAQGF